MKETDSSSIQRNISTTRESTTSKINNDNSTKDQSHNTRYSNNSTEQHKNKTWEKRQAEDKNDRKKEKPVIILGDSIVMHINGWENDCRSSKFM